jgi:hypothetical protein
MVWYHNSVLGNMNISFSQLEKLITIFLDNKSAKDAYDILGYDFVNEKLNIKTARRYFSIFSEITLNYYQQRLSTEMLDGDIELDETYLFKEKKSFAGHRAYKLRSVWLFGMRKRNSPNFLIIPMTSREESTIHLTILKHVKRYSKIYTDSFAAYVNNHTKLSKLIQYDYNHVFVNHRIEFVSSLFSEIHTNRIENLWKLVKGDLKKKTCNIYICPSNCKILLSSNAYKGGTAKNSK